MLAANLAGKTQSDVMGITFIYIAHAVVAVACVATSQSAAVTEPCLWLVSGTKLSALQCPAEQIRTQHCMNGI